jgi:hypothetical protein
MTKAFLNKITQVEVVQEWEKATSFTSLCIWKLGFCIKQKNHQQKLDHHIVECIFLGYNEENNAYKLMKKHDKVIIISCDVILEEMSNQVSIIDDTKDSILDPNFFKPHTNHSSIHVNYTTHSNFCSCSSISNLTTYFSNYSTPWST